MASERNITYFFRNLRKKHRLSLRDQHDDNEVWYMHISPLELIGGLVAFLLVMFIIVLTAVAYTPVLNLIPGYSGIQDRETMIQNILRVDSIERRLNELQLYSTDVSLIMEGRTPVVRNVAQAGDSMQVSRPETVPPNAADSALRRQMEGTGIYGLSNTQAGRGGRQVPELIAPVSGVITSYFDPREGHFGIGIATASNQQVLAVEEGTVIMSAWTPDAGYIIQVQHAGNLISVYRHASQSTAATGARVRAGEVIGYTGEGISGDEGKGLLEFQLWQNGAPVDPEKFIIF